MNRMPAFYLFDIDRGEGGTPLHFFFTKNKQMFYPMRKNLTRCRKEMIK